jgi:hypothetical protein
MNMDLTVGGSCMGTTTTTTTLLFLSEFSVM